MTTILAVKHKNGRKYIVARGSKYDFVASSFNGHVESVSGSFPTGLYYDQVASLVPLGHDIRFLILGLGGGTVARLYRELGGRGLIYGVELDPEMVQIGLEYFQLEKADVNIIFANAKHWVENAKLLEAKFDVVFDDVYKNTEQKVQIDARALVKKGGLYIVNENYGRLKIENF